ncbi:hypothetical protein BKA69DRAFT_938436 [Paraphysoderma sedebokerense]|nr:hypothetical protein BKA69DRAFT_938436 [Paraphysoderma sedebokerense]
MCEESVDNNSLRFLKLLEQLLNIWSDKNYFPPETIQNLRSLIAKPSLPIPSHSMPPSGAIPRIHPSAPYAPPPNFPPFPPPPMHLPPLHPPIPLHHPPHHTARPPMLPPQMGAIPPPGLFPPPPPHTGQLPMPPMPIIPPVPIPGVNPPIPKQYHELPAGLMVPLVKVRGSFTFFKFHRTSTNDVLTFLNDTANIETVYSDPHGINSAPVHETQPYRRIVVGFRPVLRKDRRQIIETRQK